MHTTVYIFFQTNKQTKKYPSRLRGAVFKLLTFIFIHFEMKHTKQKPKKTIPSIQIIKIQ